MLKTLFAIVPAVVLATNPAIADSLPKIQSSSGQAPLVMITRASICRVRIMRTNRATEGLLNFLPYLTRRGIDCSNTTSSSEPPIRQIDFPISRQYSIIKIDPGGSVFIVCRSSESQEESRAELRLSSGSHPVNQLMNQLCRQS